MIFHSKKKDIIIENFTNSKYYKENSVIYQYELVKKLDFYGYHNIQETFLKIYVYDE